MGFKGVIDSITSGGITHAIQFMGDTSTPLMVILGLGVFIIAVGALISWASRG